MDVRILPVDGNYGLSGVQAGTVLFQFLPDERNLALDILRGMHSASECPEARAELHRIIEMLDPSFSGRSSVLN